MHINYWNNHRFILSKNYFIFYNQFAILRCMRANPNICKSILANSITFSKTGITFTPVRSIIRISKAYFVTILWIEHHFLSETSVYNTFKKTVCRPYILSSGVMNNIKIHLLIFNWRHIHIVTYFELNHSHKYVAIKPHPNANNYNWLHMLPTWAMDAPSNFNKRNIQMSFQCSDVFKNRNNISTYIFVYSRITNTCIYETEQPATLNTIFTLHIWEKIM